MRILIAALLIITALPVLAAPAPSGCGTLCGSWQLDAGSREAALAAVEASLAKYKDPRPTRQSMPSANDPIEGIRAEMENSLGPIQRRPGREGLKAELLPRVMPPEKLVIEARGTDIILRTPERSERRLSPGVSHARVDAEGTAKIQCSWSDGKLIVSDKYDRRRQSIETYAVQRKDGTLVVTLEMRRPGLKALRIHSVYHRD